MAPYRTLNCGTIHVCRWRNQSIHLDRIGTNCSSFASSAA
jgi:hypothetical protein